MSDLVLLDPHYIKAAGNALLIPVADPVKIRASTDHLLLSYIHRLKRAAA